MHCFDDLTYRAEQVDGVVDTFPYYMVDTSGLVIVLGGQCSDLWRTLFVLRLNCHHAVFLC